MEIVSNDAKQCTVRFAPKGEELKYILSGGVEDLSPLFSGSYWSAMVWQESVFVMCRYIQENATEEFEGKTVVELGCGLGVPGITACLAGRAKQVFLTDREEDLVQLRRSLRDGASSLSEEARRALQVVDFDWNALSAPPILQQSADVILAVECISADAYGAESLHALVRAIESVRKRGQKTALYICSCRREEEDGLDHVLHELLRPYPSHCVKKEGKVELYKIVL